MGRPKFTPDPPPVGGSEADYQAWAQQQYNRISDWWPKDLEDRLKALEQSWPYRSGVFPIIDYSSVSFLTAPEDFVVPAIEVSCMVFGGSNCYLAPTYQDIIDDRASYVTYTASSTINRAYNSPTEVIINDGNDIVISRNGGDSWTKTTYASEGFTNNSQGMVYCADEDTWLWIGRKAAGSIPWVKRSSDGGLTWSEVHSGNYGGDDVYPAVIADNGAGIQAFVGKASASIQNTYCYYTANNGVSWSRSSTQLPGGHDAEKCFYINGAWYATGKAHSIWRNANTVPNSGWAKVYTGGSGVFQNVSWIEYANGEYFATRSDLNEPLLTSTDGITWSVRQSNFGSYGNHSLAYDPNVGDWAACSGTNFNQSDDNWVTYNTNSGWGSLTGCKTLVLQAS